MKTSAALSAGLFALVCAALQVAARDTGKRFPAGPLEPFTLRDTTGREHRITPLEKGQAKGYVLTFHGVGCPISKLYASRLEKLNRQYGPRGVRFFGINANRQDTVPEMRAFAREHGLTFPALKDHDASVADSLGAKRTTEVFVLDSGLRAVYSGPVDDQYTLTDRSVGQRKDRPEAHWLRDALDALVAGKLPEVTRRPSPG